MQGKDLRIVFMGTPDFAVESLKALVENGYQVAGVITAPDKPAGRGQKLSESAVKQYAVSQNLTVLQPEKLKNPEFIAELQSLHADLQIVVAFRMLPEIVWNMPRLGTFNLHASLLPQYRGAAPINWAVINGETESGVTTFLLDHEIDTGRILLQEKVAIGEHDNAGVLHDQLMTTGTGLVLQTVELLAKGENQGIPQEKLIADPSEIKHAPKIYKDDCRINWTNDVRSINNLIRGLSPYPAAWTEMKQLENEQAVSVKIFAAHVEKSDSLIKNKPGELSTDGKKELKVACANGWLKITELQLSGKKRMKTDELLRGFQQIKDYSFI